MLLDIAVEHRLHGRKIETATRDVRTRLSNEHWQATLSGADVNDRAEILPGEFRHHRLGDRESPAGHAGCKRFKGSTVGVQGGIMPRRSCSALRLSAPQCLGQ